MEDIIVPVTKMETTFAEVSSTEEIGFYGELANKYEARFRVYKDDIMSMDRSPAHSFLAKQGFDAKSNDFFQKIDIITL